MERKAGNQGKGAYADSRRSGNGIPGVAEPCLEIASDEKLAYTYTGKWNTVAVITDGTAVLGLGDIGPAAAMPVMEGKCALFKSFAGIDAVPICVNSPGRNR